MKCDLGAGTLRLSTSRPAGSGGGTDPELPFTVSGIEIPGQAPASATASASASAVPLPDTGGPRPATLLPLVALFAGTLAVGYAALRRAS